MRTPADRLAARDEANLVLDHAGQVNVFLIAGLLAPGGFVGRGDDMTALRAAIGERITSIPALRRVPLSVGRSHRWVEVAPELDQHIQLIAPIEGIGGLERKSPR